MMILKGSSSMQQPIQQDILQLKDGDKLHQLATNVWFRIFITILSCCYAIGLLVDY
jgi:hypothetical protein